MEKIKLLSGTVFNIFLVIVAFNSLLNIVSGFNFTINNYGFRGFSEISQEYTPYLSVVLVINHSVGDFCRFCNDNNSEGNVFCSYEGNWSSWEVCPDFKYWELEDYSGVNAPGMKYVFGQLDTDCTGGCSPEFYANDTIFYDYTGRGLDVTPPLPPVVYDDGNYTNINCSIHVSWTPAIDQESEFLKIPILYKVRVLENGSNITDWFDVGEETEVTINLPYDMKKDINYSVQVLAINSVNLTANDSSDGLFYDDLAPVVFVNSSVSGNWSSDTHPVFYFNASDELSGIKGFSFKINDQKNYTPDDEIDFLGQEGNVSFYLPSGIYYFHIKAIDNALNPSEVTHYKVMVDDTPPSKPIFNSSIYYSSDSTVYWQAAVDKESGIADYYVELALDNNFNDVAAGSWINSSENHCNLSMFNVKTGLYYVRVKAKNGVGLESVFSNEKETMVDQEPPVITIVKPKDSLSYNPIVGVKTNEDAVCYYIVGEIFKKFDYTGQKYHEAYLSFLENKIGSYDVIVRCIDYAQNPAEISLIISLKKSNVLNSLSIYKSEEYKKTHLNSYDILTQYTNQYLTFIVDIDPKYSGMENLFSFYVEPQKINIDEFNEFLKQNNINTKTDIKSKVLRKFFSEDFGIKDLGSGEYSIKFKAPRFPGLYRIYVKALNVEKWIDFQVLPLNLTMRYINLKVKPANVTSSESIVSCSFIDNNLTFGFALNKKPYLSSLFYLDSKKVSEINGSFSTQDFAISSSIDSQGLIFLTPKITSLSLKKKLLSKGSFLEYSIPSFGKAMNYENILNLIISPEDVVFDSNEHLLPGKYTLYFENEGLDSNKKVIKISQLEMFDEEVKYVRYDVYG